MARQDVENSRQIEPDLDGDHSLEGKEKSSKGPKGTAKAKDLSHVPCKFHRLGACTAGASCPFSHQAAEPGQQKGICQWYIKGNCKFGHKCALAHVLPGQPMSMDRKNKRAEQALAQGKGAGGSSKDREHSARGDRADRENKRLSGSDRAENNSEKGAEPESGKTAPVAITPRQPMTSRPPMTIGKAPPTVSATGSEPPLLDTDFRRPDDTVRRPSVISSFAAAAAAGIHSASVSSAISRVSASSTSNGPSTDGVASPTTPPNGRDSPLTPAVAKPVVSSSTPIEPFEDKKSSPIPQSRPAHRSNLSSDRGFGPIGSPPVASRLGGSPSKLAQFPPTGGISLAMARQSLNDFSPATSPPSNKFDFDPSVPGGFGTSPFSNPSSLFMTYGQGGSVPTRPHHTHTTSVGGERPSAGSRGVSGIWDNNPHQGSLPATTFLASALGNGQNSSSAVVDDDLEEFLPSSLNELLTPGERSRRLSRNASGRPTFTDPQPRFASSVPATGLLSNVRALWDEDMANGVTQPKGSVGPDPWGRKNDGLSASIGSDLPSPSFLGTSNASAAFLTSHLHRNNGTTLDAFSSNQFGAGSSFDANHNSLLNGSSDVAFSPPRHSNGNNPSQSKSAFALNDSSYYGLRPHQARPIADSGGPRMALSPSSRALRSHEPGQSLPQGLAAGLSRLHLIPATNPISPPPVSGGSPHDGFQQQQASWFKTELHSPTLGSSPGSGIASPPRSSGLGAFGGLAGATSPSPSSIAISGTAASQLRRPWMPLATFSPLSRPTVPDDDAMFAMDDES